MGATGNQSVNLTSGGDELLLRTLDVKHRQVSGFSVIVLSFSLYLFLFLKIKLK